MIGQWLFATCLAAVLGACARDDVTTASQAHAATSAQTTSAQAGDDDVSGKPFAVQDVARFNEPWAMTFLPDGRLLVTEKPGGLKLLDPANGHVGDIGGMPEVDYGGQGGLGDVIVHPGFSGNAAGTSANRDIVYLSYAEAGDGNTRGAAVARARLTLDDNGSGALSDLMVIWRQVPKVSGSAHYGHRLAFAPDGYLWISSGERMKFDPAQDMASNLGKIVRLNADGSVPADNPFADRDGVTAQIWSLGHRNPLGIAFDAQGRLWSHEMGPRGGDELNLVQRGGNYGWPIASNGEHYDGRPIPDHDSRPQFIAPAASWTPVISPAGFVIYSGDLFGDWRGDGLIGALSGQALVRVEFDGGDAREAARYDMGQRIREVEQGPDGALWLLEDANGGSGGRLLKLTPAG